MVPARRGRRDGGGRSELHLSGLVTTAAAERRAGPWPRTAGEAEAGALGAEAAAAAAGRGRVAGQAGRLARLRPQDGRGDGSGGRGPGPGPARAGGMMTRRRGPGSRLLRRLLAAAPTRG